MLGKHHCSFFCPCCSEPAGPFLTDSCFSASVSGAAVEPSTGLVLVPCAGRCPRWALLGTGSGRQGRRESERLAFTRPVFPHNHSPAGRGALLLCVAQYLGGLGQFFFLFNSLLWKISNVP